MSLRIGSLFSGYLGLDMAIKAAIGGETAWVSDVCKINDDGTVGHHDPCRAPCTILAHRAPEAPNLGDVTQVDWATVPRVDDVPGVTRNEALKAIGNGVVPQQAEAAVRWLLHQIQTHALDGAA